MCIEMYSKMSGSYVISCTLRKNIMLFLVTYNSLPIIIRSIQAKIKYNEIAN